MLRFTLAAALLFAACPAAAQEGIVTEADGTRTLVNEALIPAPPEAVWQAVTTVEGWKRWAAPQAWAVPGDPELIETAYDPAAGPGGPDTIRQRFVAKLPGRLLVFRTVKTPAGFPHAEAFLRVTQFLELAPEGGGTRVRLSGTGYPAGAEGDALLGFFRTGNRHTLDAMSAALALAPLDFLAGHCWRGSLPTGEANIHCFRAAQDSVTDHHDVLRDGKSVYSGETLYRWDAAAGAIAFTYSSGGKIIGEGHVRPVAGGLDFGSSDYGSGAEKVTIATRWMRVGSNAYDAIDSSANQAYARTTRYTRTD